MNTSQSHQNSNKSFIISANSTLASDLNRFKELVIESYDTDSENKREEAAWLFKQMASKLPFDIYRKITDSWNNLYNDPDSLLFVGNFESCCRQSVQQLKNGYVWSCNQ
jgi:hypothetical protein